MRSAIYRTCIYSIVSKYLCCAAAARSSSSTPYQWRESIVCQCLLSIVTRQLVTSERQTRPMTSISSDSECKNCSLPGSFITMLPARNILDDNAVVVTIPWPRWRRGEGTNSAAVNHWAGLMVVLACSVAEIKIWNRRQGSETQYT